MFVSGQGGVEPGNFNFHNTIPETVMTCSSVYPAKFVSQLLIWDIKSNGLKATVCNYIYDYFPFLCIFSPFLLISFTREKSYSHLIRIAFGFIHLLCCFLLFVWLNLCTISLISSLSLLFLFFFILDGRKGERYFLLLFF